MESQFPLHGNRETNKIFLWLCVRNPCSFHKYRNHIYRKPCLLSLFPIPSSLLGFSRESPMAGFQSGSLHRRDNGPLWAGPLCPKQIQPSGKWQAANGQSHPWHQTWPVSNTQLGVLLPSPNSKITDHVLCFYRVETLEKKYCVM